MNTDNKVIKIDNDNTHIVIQAPESATITIEHFDDEIAQPEEVIDAEEEKEEP